MNFMYQNLKSQASRIIRGRRAITLRTFEPLKVMGRNKEPKNYIYYLPYLRDNLLINHLVSEHLRI